MQERITTAGVLKQGDYILIAKRESKGSIGGMWEFPGGKNRWGETEEQTLKREFLEELDLQISVGPLICTHDFINKETLYHLKAYWVYSTHQGELPLKFHTECRWVTASELENYEFAPSDQAVIRTIVGKTWTS